ncbi:hypothetical protein HAX54_045175 [Datura stramonium]|uniref:Uncharacterized protein n=1 Tax=Datura stramonium TaxID=4076 RepID=A0ABS8WKC7_DATST|nr:hypothetical protein [Datura stramonium]
MSFPSEKVDSTSNNCMPTTEMGSKDEKILAQQLKMQFLGIRKGDLETIESYVEKLKSTADSLAEIGSRKSDLELVSQLVAGLPPHQYSPYQDTISSQIPLPDFPGACSLLYMYESLLQEQKAQNPTGSDSPNKETFDKFLDVFSTVMNVATTAWDLWSMFGTLSITRTAAAAATAASTGNKKYTKRPNGGRGNYNKTGPSAGGYRKSGRK